MSRLGDRNYDACDPYGRCGCYNEPSDDYPEVEEDEDYSLLEEVHPGWRLTTLGT